MVATRRGVRVCSPSKTDRDQSSDVQATPTRPRTRSTAKKAESPTQHASGETCDHHEKVEGELSPTPSVKRCTRASRLHSPEQPSTPVGSIHEADVSDAESCCSARSDIKPPLTGTRRRQPRVIQEDDDISEVESCSSAVSASRVGRSTRRSIRRTILESFDAPQFEAGDAKVDLELVSEPRSCVTSESRRVTRSQRKTACTRSSAKQQTDSELSDTDSYLSGVSGPGVSKSTSRRVTRSRKQTGPIPIHLDEASESSRSPAPTSRRSQAARGKAAATVDVSESQSCDSDGFESGPTYGLADRRQRKTCALDSDSELSTVHSPMSSPCRGTPCSTRAGSGISSQGTSPSRCVTILEKAEEPAEKDTSLNDSRLESTVMAEEADCTLLEENESQTLEGKEKDGVSSTDPTSNEADTVREEKEVNAISEEHPPMSDMQLDMSACATDVSESAVSVIHQQEELSDENKREEKPSEMEMMQETVHSPELLQPCQSVTLCERTPETTEETGEQGRVTAAADDTQPSQRDDAVDEGAVEQTLPKDQEQMEVIRSSSEAQQVVNSSEAQVESIQITSSQQHIITVDSGPEQQPDDVIVQKTTKISLLSSDDDDEEEEGAVDEEEGEVDLGHIVEGGGGSSNKSEAAGTSIDGLFMIDTRPGQDADDQYYMEKLTEEEVKERSEEEEGEVDEEEGEVDLGHIEDGGGSSNKSEAAGTSIDGLFMIDTRPGQDADDQYYMEKLTEEEVKGRSEEEEEEGGGEVDEEEGEVDLGHIEDGGGSSNKSEAAGTSIDGLFMIDTRPGQDADDQYYMEKLTEEEVKERSEEEQDEEFVDEEGDEDDDEDADVLFSTRNSLVKEMSSRIDPGIKVKDLGGLYINFDGSKSKPVSSSLQKLKEKKIQDEVMKKSVIGPDFEKKDAVPPYTESKQALKLKHRVEREKSTGDGWFNMKAPEISQELKGELNVLKMRGSLDPKRFYKKNDRDGFPKFFQVGTVVDNPVDFYHSRIPKKDRKRTMVEELLADAEFRHNNKKKYQQIIADNAAKGAGKWNKKKKVHKK